MSVVSKIQDRIAHEDERIRNLEEQLPALKSQHELAEHQADRIEGDLLLRDATEGVLDDTTGATDEALRRAKVAVNERRRAVEQAERELRLARTLRDRLNTTLQTLQDTDFDGQLAALDQRIPKVAERLADAWQAYEDAAQEADEVRREHARLKALVPVRGVSLGLTNAVPRFPGLEELRAKQPHQSQRHPVSVLRSLGYTELASRLAEGR